MLSEMVVWVRDENVDPIHTEDSAQDQGEDEVEREAPIRYRWITVGEVYGYSENIERSQSIIDEEVLSPLMLEEILHEKIRNVDPSDATEYGV